MEKVALSGYEKMAPQNRHSMLVEDNLTLKPNLKKEN